MKRLMFLSFLSMQLTAMDLINNLKNKVKHTKQQNKQQKLNKQLHKCFDQVTSRMHLDIKSCIEKGADVNSYYKGTTALHKCTKWVSHDLDHIIEILIQNGADPNLKTDDALKQTVLHRSVCNNQIQNVKKLLELGADVTVLDAEGKSPLHCACIAINGIYNNNKTSVSGFTPSDDVVKLLLSQGASPFFYNEKQQTTALNVMRNEFAVIFEHAQFNAPQLGHQKIAQIKKKLHTALFCFKKLGYQLPVDVKLHILSYIPEFYYDRSMITKLLSYRDAKLIPTIMAQCPFMELKQLIPTLKDDQQKAAFMEAIINHRIDGCKKLLAIKNKSLSDLELATLSLFAGLINRDVREELDISEDVFEEKYRQKITANVFRDLGLAVDF